MMPNSKQYVACTCRENSYSFIQVYPGVCVASHALVLNSYAQAQTYIIQHHIILTSYNYSSHVVSCYTSCEYVRV